MPIAGRRYIGSGYFLLDIPGRLIKSDDGLIYTLEDIFNVLDKINRIYDNEVLIYKIGKG
jgi:arginyl-tRNA synthetase